MIRILDGLEVAGFIQQRHFTEARSLRPRPRLAVVRCAAPGTDRDASDRYLSAKRRYGAEIGIPVDIIDEVPATLIDRIESLGADSSVAGIIVQLPLSGAGSDGSPLSAAALAKLTDDALAAVPPAKDVDGLAPGSLFEATTPKAIMWLLAAYSVALEDRVIAVVGQGRLVGRPLADRLESAGHRVVRLDDKTPAAELPAALGDADIVVAATGVPGLITPAMLKAGAVVIDAGAPRAELAGEAIAARPDIKYSPVPGGVGPMTVAALFDNLLIAAKRQPAPKIPFARQPSNQ